MPTNIKLSEVNKKKRTVRKSLIEVLNEAQRSNPGGPLGTLRELNKEKRIRQVRDRILERIRPTFIKKTIACYRRLG